ncbi:hypothetical protein HK101_000825 [Irineochytrium annulatum]|nr:hypothetical protein HK101_000825 [Irineochytrium annulatum]
MAGLRHHFNTHYNTIDQALAAVPPLMELEVYTKIHRLRLIGYAIVGIVFIVLVLNNYGKADRVLKLTHALGFFYPALESLRVAETGKKEDFQHWISFWVILSALTLLEFSDQGAQKVYGLSLRHVFPATVPVVVTPAGPIIADSSGKGAPPLQKRHGWAYEPLRSIVR